LDHHSIKLATVIAVLYYLLRLCYFLHFVLQRDEDTFVTLSSLIQFKELCQDPIDESEIGIEIALESNNKWPEKLREL
jgi:hypothetical protein